jgi:hypothetical protein
VTLEGRGLHGAIGATRTIIAVGIPEYGMAIINIREKKIFFRFHNLKTGWFCRTHQPFESSVLCVYCLRISKMLAKQFSTSFSKVFTLVLIVSSQMFDTVQGNLNDDMLLFVFFTLC